MYNYNTRTTSDQKVEMDLDRGQAMMDGDETPRIDPLLAQYRFFAVGYIWKLRHGKTVLADRGNALALA